MLAMRSAYGPFLASDWKTPSAMVDRQMLPKQTNRTEMGEDIGMWKEIGRNGIGGAWIRRCCRCVCFTTGTVVGQRAGHDGPERISRVRVRRVNTDDSRVEARQQSRQRQPLDWAANLGPTKRINNLKGKNGKRREWEMFCPRHRPRQLQVGSRSQLQIPKWSPSQCTDPSLPYKLRPPLPLFHLFLFSSSYLP